MKSFMRTRRKALFWEIPTIPTKALPRLEVDALLAAEMAAIAAVPAAEAVAAVLSDLIFAIQAVASMVVNSASACHRMVGLVSST